MFPESNEGIWRLSGMRIQRHIDARYLGHPLRAVEDDSSLHGDVLEGSQRDGEPHHIVEAERLERRGGRQPLFDVVEGGVHLTAGRRPQPRQRRSNRCGDRRPLKMPGVLEQEKFREPAMVRMWQAEGQIVKVRHGDQPCRRARSTSTAILLIVSNSVSSCREGSMTM